jgi:hypothetical protein
VAIGVVVVVVDVVSIGVVVVAPVSEKCRSVLAPYCAENCRR